MILQINHVKRIFQRQQSPLPDLWLQFTLPHRYTVPSHPCQLSLCLPVAFLVPSYLVYPELPVGLRYSATIRVLNLFVSLALLRSKTHMVSMPETSIHKYARPVFPQHKVRMSWQSSVIQSVSESPFPQPSSHGHLRSCILRPYSRHVPMSLFGREGVHC